MDKKSLKKRALEDYYFFCREVLGYDRMIPEVHGELCKFTEKWRKRTKLILMPRNSFKSSVVTVGKALHHIVNHPNERVLISSETGKKANKFVQECKDHLEINKRFRALFGDLRSDGNTWRNFEFTVNTRTIPKKEPSISSASLEKSDLTGMHYDLIIMDDVVSPLNTNTPEQIEKTIEHFRYLLSVLDPEGHLIVIGTRWHFSDLYGYLQDPDSPEYDMTEVFLRQAIDDDGKLTMPSILSKEFLEQMRKSQGEQLFVAQYLNRAITSDTAFFKKENLVVYDENPYGLIYFMTLDPAITQGRRSDYSAIIVNGVDYYGNWYIQEAVKFKGNPSDIVDKLFEFARKYKPIMNFAMEKYTLEKMLKFSIEERMAKEDFFFPITDLPVNNRVSKEVRIRALQPEIENKRVRVRLPEHQDLYNELVAYPHVKHDDLTDALKSMIQIVFPSDQKYDNSEDANRRRKRENLKKRERRIWEGIDDLVKKRRVRQKKEEYI